MGVMEHCIGYRGRRAGNTLTGRYRGCYIEGNMGREFYRAGLNITLCELDLMGGVYTLWEHTIYLSYIFIS